MTSQHRMGTRTAAPCEQSLTHSHTRSSPFKTFAFSLHEAAGATRPGYMGVAERSSFYPRDEQSDENQMPPSSSSSPFPLLSSFVTNELYRFYLTNVCSVVRKESIPRLSIKVDEYLKQLFT